MCWNAVAREAGEELAAAVEKERALTAEAEKRMRDVQARMDAIARVRHLLAQPLALTAYCTDLRFAAVMLTSFDGREGSSCCHVLLHVVGSRLA